MLLPYVTKFPNVLIFADERGCYSAIVMNVKLIYYDILKGLVKI